jgi:HPt (histidine-containing phosphotransfer) domain-containing protein
MGSASTFMAAGSSHGVLKSRPVDLVHLARQTMGNRDLEAEVLRMFVRQAPRQLAALRAAQPGAGRGDAAHSLKGSARAIGAWGVAEAAEAIEQVPAAEGADFADLVSALEAAVARADTFIQTLID